MAVWADEVGVHVEGCRDRSRVLVGANGVVGVGIVGAEAERIGVGAWECLRGRGGCKSILVAAVADVAWSGAETMDMETRRSLHCGHPHALDANFVLAAAEVVNLKTDHHLPRPHVPVTRDDVAGGSADACILQRLHHPHRLSTPGARADADDAKAAVAISDVLARALR